MNHNLNSNAASESLRVSMNIGQSGYANLESSEEAIFTRVKAYRGATPKKNASRSGAKGFSAFLYGKEQCV